MIDWHSSVVYQIYPRSFQDSNGDGIGDLPGILQRLDHLSYLGVDVVWLSPVYCSPQDDNGYDISDYQAIDPTFGSLADLDALIEGLHARGMKLMMDLVLNHTSDEHPWFRESRDRASDKRDWYWWRPALPGHESGTPGAEPTNWASVFSGPAWAFDERSGEYYLHMFSRRQPDLNWENPAVRQELHRMMRWWLDRGVDGFRMDVINMVSKPAELRDGPVPPGQSGSPCFHSVANGPRLHEFLKEMNQAVGLRERGVLTVGEMPDSTVGLARQVTDPAERELDMVFTFEHVELDQQSGASKWDLAPLSLPQLKSTLGRWQRGLAESGWNSLYWSNHDQPRAVSRFGDDSPELRVLSARTLATVLHLHRGTPYIYQGEEIGLTNAGFTEAAQYRDLESLRYRDEALARGQDEADVMRSLAAKGRDNARTPIPWDAGAQAGFSSGEPWIGFGPSRQDINVEGARRDPDGVLAHYRALIAFRHANDTVVEGSFELLHADHPHLWVVRRRTASEELLMVANCSSRPVALPLDLCQSPDEVLLATGQRSVAHAGPWHSWVMRNSR